MENEDEVLGLHLIMLAKFKTPDKRKSCVFKVVILFFIVSIIFVKPLAAFEDYFDVTNGSVAEMANAIPLDEYGFNSIKILGYSFENEPGLLGAGWKFDFESRLMRDIGNYLVFVPITCKNKLFYYPHFQFRPVGAPEEPEITFQSDLNKLASAAIYILDNKSQFNEIHDKILELMAGRPVKEFQMMRNILENDGPLRVRVLAAVSRSGLFNSEKADQIKEWRGNGSRILKEPSEHVNYEYKLLDRSSVSVFNKEGQLLSYRRGQAYPEAVFNYDGDNRLKSIVSCGVTNKIKLSETGQIFKIIRDNSVLFEAYYEIKNNLAAINLFEQTPIYMTYDEHNRLKTTNKGDMEIVVSYDEKDRLVSLGNGWINMLFVEYHGFADRLGVKAYKGPGAYYIGNYTAFKSKTSKKRGFKIIEEVKSQIKDSRPEFYFDSNWNLTKSINTYYPVKSSYDEDGYLTSISTEGETENFKYCPVSKKMLELSSSNGKTSSFKYDEQGRLIVCTKNDGTEISFSYKSEYAIVPEKAVYKNGAEINFLYNSYGMVSEVKINNKTTALIVYSLKSNEPAEITIIKGDDSIEEITSILNQLTADLQGSDLELINLDGRRL